jgi:2-C-methyl-D-erythritol 4-phosphate cytidylyltransferase/2-C-methyl-D-erythritol 2,4-cyclodiphosphate synthase
MNSLSSLFVIVPAAGRGTRAGGHVPKQYRSVRGLPILRLTLQRLLDAGLTSIRVAIHPDDEPLYRMATDGLLDHAPDLRTPIVGGVTRQASVHAVLETISNVPPHHVLIHDAARPFVTRALIGRLLDALGSSGIKGVVPVVPIADTLKRVGEGGVIETTIDRQNLHAVQTPQAFDFSTIIAAHRAARAAGRDDFTDDAALLEWQGVKVAIVPGEVDNFKLTSPEDFARAERTLQPAGTSVRVGIGYDVHAFGVGDGVWLGGVRIPYGKGIVAHSDGDVVLHALTDALLGAIGDGDIGTHFPPSDPAWHGASSARFLAHAVRRVRGKGGAPVHLDVTVIAEAPRIGPHRAEMTLRIAEICGVPPDAVSIKATTSEKMGFTGRGEGLAALAVATVAFGVCT